MRGVLAGAAAGAAGTTALNAATYLDMAVRGRPASTTPEQTVTEIADRTPLSIPGDQEMRNNRVSGLAPLLGVAAGVGAGAVCGAVRSLVRRPGPVASGSVATAVALLAGNLPMTGLGITDPRSWSLEAWLSDVVPHVAYGFVTGPLLARLDP